MFTKSLNFLHQNKEKTIEFKQKLGYTKYIIKRSSKMKKFNTKGFTLIELLAVITIMGILMLVAIPTISRTIENSRKDMFIDTAKQYTQAAKTQWASDNLSCEIAAGKSGYNPSALTEGFYFVAINTDDDVSNLLEQGGKSPWGNRTIKGYILVQVQYNETKKMNQTIFYPVITDGVHGINTQAVELDPSGVYPYEVAITQLISDEKLIRGNIQMSDATYNKVDSIASGTIRRPSIAGGEEYSTAMKCFSY